MRKPFSFLPLFVLLAACGGDPTVGSESQDATELGYAEGSLEARAILAVANDRALDLTAFDDAVKLDVRAATNLIAHRDGADLAPRTDDDDLFDTLAELDAVSWIGGRAAGKLLDYAKANGHYAAQERRDLGVIFSPQPYAQSHLARVVEEIDAAESHIDIAMYSFSDAAISDALERAVDRGVEVRFLFESGNSDKSKTGDALASSKSGRIEQMGINVRYVNKINHHKFMLVDGPRFSVETADHATIVSGSGNWSNSAGTRYDENTLFLHAYPEMTMRMQAEFDHLWNHSRDFIYDDSLPYELSTLSIDESMIDDDPGLDVFFTSPNFTVKGETTFTINWGNSVSDRLVEAIWSATDSIHIASGHLRSRPISEALMAKVAESPDLEVEVLLDGQEYISAWKQNDQEQELVVCLEEASTEGQERNCMEKGYYFGLELGEAGADVRYKYYSYRWHYTTAEQMHHKYIIIDGDELYTGSYNFSSNAEHNTFENVMMFRGPEFRDLVAAYEANFASLYDAGREAYEPLLEEVATAAEVPIVFQPMALSWEEVTTLKGAIADACPPVNSSEYRSNPTWTTCHP